MERPGLPQRALSVEPVHGRPERRADDIVAKGLAHTTSVGPPRLLPLTTSLARRRRQQRRRRRLSGAPAAPYPGHAADDAELVFRPLRAAGRHDRRTRLAHVFRRNDVDEFLDRINVKSCCKRVDALAVAATGPAQEGREDYFPSQRFREEHALEELLVLVVRAALDHDWVQELLLALLCDR